MKNRAICILGMHRSGTSVVTRAINLLGPYLGRDEDFIPPARDNEEGFWERRDIIKFHDNLLTRHNKSWDSVLPMFFNWNDQTGIESYKKELALLIERNLSSHSLWMWKDPRTMLLLDLWKDVLHELDIGLNVVFVFRNPLDVSKSLEKRNRFTRDRSLGIWLNQNISALKALENIPTVFVSYDEFLTNWKFELRRCSKGLNIEWPQDSAEIDSYMNSFIRPELRHSKTSLNDLDDLAAGRIVRELYDYLQGNAKMNSEIRVNLPPEVEKIYDDLMLYSSFYRDDVTQAWTLKREIKMFKRTIMWKMSKPFWLMKKKLVLLPK